jgi:hypothetical protein
MKLSPVATKLSLPGLTNVKKGKVLGITESGWCFILSQSTFQPGSRSFLQRYSKYPATLLVFHPVFFTGIPGNNE